MYNGITRAVIASLGESLCWFGFCPGHNKVISGFRALCQDRQGSNPRQKGPCRFQGGVASHVPPTRRVSQGYPMGLMRYTSDNDIKDIILFCGSLLNWEGRGVGRR
ncbi:hypothetical protein PoB_001819100 [Plakobranchus ocellatus]|uniref:Uncharacterized protein n=1 Tax=Plakobranchus ocellatus TaxID=259542 RepID=A0AAV3YX50_9GAST|nr:hypothetical protein PoB_001819100 [Plakobranchus ocellatus]